MLIADNSEIRIHMSMKSCPFFFIATLSVFYCQEVLSIFFIATRSVLYCQEVLSIFFIATRSVLYVQEVLFFVYCNSLYFMSKKSCPFYIES